MIAIVCVTMRPDMAQHVQRMVEHQLHPAKVVIVRNGCAMSQEYPFADIVLDGPFGDKAACFDIALQYCRDYGIERWACFDDDDYYGPKYLSSAMEDLNLGHMYTVQCDRFMRTSSGRLWLLNGTSTNGALMCTMAGLVEFTASWAGIEKVIGQEAVWEQRMRDAGYSFGVRAYGHFAQCRYGDGRAHSWNATDAHIATVSRGKVWDLGEFDRKIVDLEVPFIRDHLVPVGGESWFPFTSDGQLITPIHCRAHTAHGEISWL